MGIPFSRATICWIFLCRDRSRDNIQLNAPDEQTRSLPTIVPEHNQRRDPALGSDDGARASDDPIVYGGTETYRYALDETRLHLFVSTPLLEQVRMLAA